MGRNAILQSPCPTLATQSWFDHLKLGCARQGLPSSDSLQHVSITLSGDECLGFITFRVIRFETQARRVPVFRFPDPTSCGLARNAEVAHAVTQ